MSATNNIGSHSVTPAMATRGSMATATGLSLTMIAVGAGISSTSGFALLLSFAGLLAGGSLIFAGVRVADDPTAPIGRPAPGMLAAGVVGVRALVHCMRRNLAHVGLLLASTAATASAAAAADRATAVVCFCAFALMLLGLSLFNVGVVLLGEQQQEQER